MSNNKDTQYGTHVQGEVEVVDTGSDDIIATPGAAHRLFITKVIVSWRTT